MSGTSGSPATLFDSDVVIWFLRGDPEDGRCGDGYCMLMNIPDSQVITHRTPIKLKTILKDALRAAGKAGIAPRCDGRIGNPDHRCGRQGRGTADSGLPD